MQHDALSQCLKENLLVGKKGMREAAKGRYGIVEIWGLTAGSLLQRNNSVSGIVHCSIMTS
jgi:hypothetical protein